MFDLDRPRFLITRLSALGDCLVTLPVACALRDLYPQARIVWLTQTENAPLLRAHADIDRVISVPRRWFFDRSAVWKLRRELQSENFSAVIDPQSLTKSCAAGWLSGCRTRIGLESPHGREAAPWVNTHRVAVSPDLHVVDRFLMLLQPLDGNSEFTPGRARFCVPITREAEQFASLYLDSVRFTTPFVLVNPAAGWKSRIWCMQRYGEVLATLHSQLGVRAVVNWHGDAERQMAEAIVQKAGPAAIIADPMNLEQLAAVSKRAALFLGSDSGPMHLASCVGTPCVSLHGTTRAEISGPYGPQHIPLQAYYHGGNSRTRRSAGNEAMLAIQTSEVIDACAEIITRKKSNPIDHAVARFSHVAEPPVAVERLRSAA